MTKDLQAVLSLTLLPTIIVSLAMALLMSGCMMNESAATASMHNATVKAETDQRRIEAEQAQAQAAAVAKQAAAEAQARAEIAQAVETTNRQRLDELGAAERLYSQQNYLIAKQSEGTNRMLLGMGFVSLLIVLVGGGWLFVYMRQHPQPAAREYRQLQYLDPVRLDMLQSQQAIAVGWQIATDEFGRIIGQRVKPNGVTQRVNLLENKTE